VEELDIWVDVMNCARYKALRWVFEEINPVLASSRKITGEYAMRKPGKDRD
jgi:hypothetical protein